MSTLIPSIAGENMELARLTVNVAEKSPDEFARAIPRDMDALRLSSKNPG
jgi:hypothetical protein